MTIAPVTRRSRSSAPALPPPAATRSPSTRPPATKSTFAEGTKVDYAQTPPDSGKHYPTPAPFTKHFYAEADRPPVETLVHNLEHGYTVVWYRADAPSKQIKDLQRIAKTFGSDDYDPADKFIAAPWSDADGAGFPAGKNIVITRWTADPNDPSNPAQQKGVRQACTERQRRGDQGLHDQVPGRELPRAQRRVTARSCRATAYPPPSWAVTSATSSLIRSASVIGQTRVICGV